MTFILKLFIPIFFFLLAPTVSHPALVSCEVGNLAHGKWENIYSGVSQAAAWTGYIGYTGERECEVEQVNGSQKVWMYKRVACPKDIQSHPQCPVDCEIGQATGCYYEAYGYKPGYVISCGVYQWVCNGEGATSPPFLPNIGPPQSTCPKGDN